LNVAGGAAVTGSLEVRGLTHRFGGDRPVDVLDHVDLTATSGRFVSVVGPSGCGKSTLLRIVAGLLTPTRGTSTLDGRSTVDEPGSVSYMPQRDLLLPWRRALDNALLGAVVAGDLRDEVRARGEAWFERFGLAGFERAWPTQLSGGMRQRVALLRTFLMDRDVVLLDEPFGALDAITRRDMHDWLQELLEAEPRTVLFVTHDVPEALYLSDEVHVMTPRPGRVAASFEVPFTHPRPRQLVTDPGFVAIEGEVLDALDRAVQSGG
jgi:ABC-type nitrate/sulfonate/bicarbonate transport system ATPase subunit